MRRVADLDAGADGKKRVGFFFLHLEGLLEVRFGCDGKTLVSGSKRAEPDDRKQVLTHFAGSHNFRPALTLLVSLPLLSISIPTHRHPRLLNWFHHFQPLLLPLPLSVRASFRQLFGGAQNESLVYVFWQPAVDVLAVRLLPASRLRIWCWLPWLWRCLRIMWRRLWCGSRRLPNGRSAWWSSRNGFCSRLSNDRVCSHSDHPDVLTFVPLDADACPAGRSGPPVAAHSFADHRADRTTWAGWTTSAEPEVS